MARHYERHRRSSGLLLVCAFHLALIVIPDSSILSGNFDLTGILGWIGETQLKILTVVASFLLTATHLTTAFMVKEKILVASR
jgi:ABC-type glycerol-3-phosphate transport system permease component